MGHGTPPPDRPTPHPQARPHGKTRHLVLAPNGRYVWSIGSNNICLWDCYKHSYLGTLDKEAVATTSADFYREGEGWRSGGSGVVG